MKALVIGYGSIGERHARILKELSCQVSVVSSHGPKFEGPCTPSLETALQTERPEYIVICNKTSEHYATVKSLAALNFRGRVLIEKPLFESYREMPANNFSYVSTAYCLRFHPALLKLREVVKSLKTLSVQAYAGKYLPDWRPDRDYRDKYSAKKFEGGGVLRDLSHELDFLLWLFGPWKFLTALGGHKSSLEIDTDDLFMLLWETESGVQVQLQLNYLDKIRRREVLVITEGPSLRADLVRSTLDMNDKTESFEPDIQEIYRAQHQAVLSGDPTLLCSIPEALEVMKMIEAAEESSRRKRWVSRGVKIKKSHSSALGATGWHP